LNRNQKILLGSVVSIGVALSIMGLWFFGADIRYARGIAIYEKKGDQWITRYNDEPFNGTFTTVHCGNIGLWEGSFSIVLTFTNATVSPETSQPYQKVSDTVAKLSYKLQKDEWQDSVVCFTIGENVTGFSIKLELESSQPFIRSINNNGQTVMDYILSPQENAFLPNTIG
jgi:hypothetical protein